MRALVSVCALIFLFVCERERVVCVVWCVRAAYVSVCGFVSVCVCVCVRERERESLGERGRDRDRERERVMRLCVGVVLVCRAVPG